MFAAFGFSQSPRWQRTRYVSIIEQYFVSNSVFVMFHYKYSDGLRAIGE